MLLGGLCVLRCGSGRGAGHFLVFILVAAWLVTMIATTAGQREGKPAGGGKDRLGNSSNPK